jgi:glutathione S-transferase
LTEERRKALEQKQELGYAALSVMERHLSQHTFFVAGRYSIADIALYAYTHVADEGEFDLSRFPAILSWLDRMRTQSKHIPITQG